MTFASVFCSTVNWIDWLQNHLLSCPFKYIITLDCPGCGFQRSCIELLKGDFQSSWDLYPPTVPLLILFLAAGILSIFKSSYKTLVIKILALIAGNFVFINYAYKLFTHAL